MMQHCRAFLGDDRDVDGVVERWKARLVTLRAQAYSRMNVEFDCAIRLLEGLFAQRA
jgi:anti-sigma-K factor RskA